SSRRAAAVRSASRRVPGFSGALLPRPLPRLPYHLPLPFRPLCPAPPHHHRLLPPLPSPPPLPQGLLYLPLRHHRVRGLTPTEERRVCTVRVVRRRISIRRR